MTTTAPPGASPPGTSPSDAAARARVSSALGQSMVVTGGAGTGKTAALAERVVALVRSGEASPDEVAVVTSTEAAAAEIRNRVRRGLEEALGPAPHDRRVGRAIEELDRAAIGTVHAFARRILAGHAVSAGIPPGFEVLDACADRADFEAGLTDLLDELLDDADAEPIFLRGLVLGLDDRAIAELAWSLRAQWDRLAGAIDPLDAARPGATWPRCDARAVVDALDRCLAWTGRCTEDGDLLRAHLTGRLAEARTLLAAAGDDEQALLPLLARLPSFASGLGRIEHWDGRVGEVRAACAAAEQSRQAVLAAAGAPVAAELLARLAHAALDDAARRARQGRLTFHDLLVHARRLLAGDADARAALRRRYRRLLVDELEDADRLQVELAGWLASAVKGDGDLEQVRPGTLFVVGDPGRSVYRSRLADDDLFERVCDAIGERVELTTDLRSVPGILAFVDTVFAELLAPQAGNGQAAHARLAAARRAHPNGARAGAGLQQRLPGMAGPDDPEGPLLELPPVVVLGGPVDITLGELRRTAARDVAAAVRRAVVERWPVSGTATLDAPATPAGWRDVAVLIPVRSALAPLEEAFDDADVPYRLEGAALLWGSDDVRDVIDALAAADDPADPVAVLAALRSPGLGCGDDDLVGWHRGGGTFDPLAAPPPGMAQHPVGRALAVLAALHERRLWCEPSELVRLAVAELRSVALTFAHRRPRDHWRRLGWLREQARAFDDSPGGSLRDFLRWAELQRQGDGRAPVLGPPEADDDAVRVMTLHGAKGREFPVVVVAGLERDDALGQRPDPLLWTGGVVPEVRAGAALRSGGYDAAAEADRALDLLEQVRLLYVAMTRARDHLVVCVHHRARDGAREPGPAARLHEICRAHPLLWRRLPGSDDGRRPPAGTDVRTDVRTEAFARAAAPRTVAAAARVLDARGVPEDEEALAAATAGASAWAEQLASFQAARHERLRRLRRLPVVAATSLVYGDGSGPADGGDPPPDDAPRVGADEALGAEDVLGVDEALAIDRAVHAAMAAVDLGGGRDAALEAAPPLARLQAAVHGVPQHAEALIAMVDRALGSDVVRRAGGRRHRTGVSVAMGVGSGILEGSVDLVVEEDSGLVLVEYKTDRVRDAVDLAALSGRYEPQVAACAAALEAATGRIVARCVLLFLDRAPAVAHVLAGEDLASAKAAALARGSELAAAPA